MLFENHTPFPALAWENLDNKGKTYATVAVRVKYLFDTMDSEGLWTLKLAPEQGELLSEDVHYENNTEAAVRLANEYVPYKPHADLVVNAYAHSKESRTSWECGVKVARFNKEGTGVEPLATQWLKVYGERQWEEGLLGWKVGKAKPSKKVAIRYENAYGGSVVHPEHTEALPKEDLLYYEPNPIGKGIIHKTLNDKGKIPLAQIEAIDDPIVDPKKAYAPQGLGFIERSWEPRISLAGTFDKQWEQNKHPLMPDDFQESFNNAAHPNLQLKEKGYFEVGDSIVLHKLLKGKETQAFQVPGFYFKAKYHLEEKEAPFMLEADTLVVDVLDDSMHNNAIYIHYRKRAPYIKEIDKVSLGMIVSRDFMETPPEESINKEAVYG